MTLRDFILYLSDHPMPLMAFFIGIPLMALWVGWVDADKGHESPWRYIYAVLVFAVCIPGIFSLALSAFQFLFQYNRSILDANLLTQVVPVVSMFLTLSIVKRNIPFEYVPGLGKISSLMTLIAVSFVLMYLLDRTRIVAFVNIPVQYLLIIVLVLVLVLRGAFGRLTG